LTITCRLNRALGFVGWLWQSKDPAQIIDNRFTWNSSRKKICDNNHLSGCLSSFFRFHNQLGNTDIKVIETGD